MDTDKKRKQNLFRSLFLVSLFLASALALAVGTGNLTRLEQVILLLIAAGLALSEYVTVRNNIILKEAVEIRDKMMTLADENAARQRHWRQVAQELLDKTAAESARYKRLYEEALDELNELWKEKA
jgi:hypothetical protein